MTDERTALQALVKVVSSWLNDNLRDHVYKRQLHDAGMRRALTEAERVLEMPEGGPRESVRWFAREMERKLAINDHKGGWDDCDIEHLRGRLDEEVNELHKAVASNVVSEAADVANFAMMIADRAREDRPVPEGEQAGVESVDRLLARAVGQVSEWKGRAESAEDQLAVTDGCRSMWQQRAEKAERKLKSIRMHSTGMKRLLDGGELVQDEADAWRKVLEWLAEIEAKQE